MSAPTASARAPAGMPTPRTISDDGVETRYYDCGEGAEPIVLIYGGGDFSFTETEITECQFRLDGPAQRTANLLGSMGIDPRGFLQQPTPAQGIPPAKGEH